MFDFGFQSWVLGERNCQVGGLKFPSRRLPTSWEICACVKELAWFLNVDTLDLTSLNLISLAVQEPVRPIF